MNILIVIPLIEMNQLFECFSHSLIFQIQIQTLDYITIHFNILLTTINFRFQKYIVTVICHLPLQSVLYILGIFRHI